MNEDLLRRLRQLGVVKGTGRLKPPPPPSRPVPQAELPGETVETPYGPCHVVETRYPGDHRHGPTPLRSLLDCPSATLAHLADLPDLAEVDLSRLLFLDTETTGLAGGTGTIPFLVGLGRFEGGQFVLRQYFLRDPDQERAMLHLLSHQMEQAQALVSFNGRGFDLPILETRFLLARRPAPFLQRPHLDLLPLARRLWRIRLPSRALTALEQDVLGVRREQADVPGYLIPFLYRDYLRSGNVAPIRRILYHNVVDILSMVTLTETLSRFWADPEAAGLAPTDRYSLGRWYEARGEVEAAERAYRAALTRELPAPIRRAVLRHLSFLLKRQDRRSEAVPLWTQLAELGEAEEEGEGDAVLACVELAKYYEWHAHDIGAAITWSRRALRVVTGWPPGPHRERVEGELRHRLGRLERKAGERLMVQDL